MSRGTRICVWIGTHRKLRLNMATTNYRTNLTTEHEQSESHMDNLTKARGTHQSLENVSSTDRGLFEGSQFTFGLNRMSLAIFCHVVELLLLLGWSCASQFDFGR